jgi:hypothetical protein
MTITDSQIKQQQDNLLQLAKQYTQQELDSVIQQNKDITYAGIQSKEHPLYEKHRADLKNAQKEFQLACAFLSQCKRTRTINKQNSLSYWLKHKLERFTGTYIANGSIIAAAAALGIRYEEEGPNVWLAISKDLPMTQEMEFIARGL